MAPSRTKSSTPRLSEAARHLVIPEGIVTTGWPAVEAKAAELGIAYDPWQQGAGRVVLGKRADGKYAATVGGVTLSIPRQVGKTFWVGSLIVVLCILFPGLRVLWTAHHGATTANTFASMQGLCRRRKVQPHIARNGIRTANGQESIRFANGSRILFGAREHGFGRGLDAIDVEVFDEAQILKSKTLEDMVPATNQAKHPHGALLFFMGTPPTPENPGEEFSRRRERALAGKAADSVYVEFGADPDADPDDRKQWAKANPSFPHRTPLESMLRMRENLGADDAWKREALGIWPSDSSGPRLIPADAWGPLATATPPLDGLRSYGVKFSVDGATVALGVALRPEAGPVHLEVVEHRSMSAGTGWLVEWLAARADRAVQIVVDGKSGAGELVNGLRAAGVGSRVITAPTTEQVVTAHSMILTAIRERTVTHFDQPALTESVECADRRPIGTSGGFGFKPTGGGDVTPVESVTLAHWAAMTSKRKPGRRQRVL